MAELLANLPDGRELTEWQAFFHGDSQVQDLVAKGTTRAAAYAMVWGEPESEDD